MSRRIFGGVSSNIILLGIVSLVTDISSEMAMPILPLFITALGGGALAVGLIGGLGDSLTSVLQVFSGHWSDIMGKRKPLIFTGYSLSAIAKFFIPFSTVWYHIFALRPIERCGKGLRTAPRDAVIADSASEMIRGRVFGIHRAMDSGGAIAGSVLAFILFFFLSMEFRPILFISAVISFVAIIPIFKVKEKLRAPRKVPLQLSLKKMPKEFKLFVLIASVFALGNFTYMFFILQAQEIFAKTALGRFELGLPILFYVLFNVVYTSLSIPSGILSDKIGRRKILLLGYALFGVTCLGFAWATSILYFVIFFILYGIVFAFVDANQRAYAVDLATEELRATGLGVFHASIGLISLPSSVIAGLFWLRFGPIATFYFGSLLGFIASVLIGLRAILTSTKV